MIEEPIQNTNQTSSKKSKLRQNPLSQENYDNGIPDTKLKTSSKKSDLSNPDKELPQEETTNALGNNDMTPSGEENTHLEDKSVLEQAIEVQEINPEEALKISEEIAMKEAENNTPIKNVSSKIILSEVKPAVSKPRQKSQIKLSSKSRSKSRSKTATKKNRMKEETEKAKKEDCDNVDKPDDVVVSDKPVEEVENTNKATFTETNDV